MTLVDGGGRVSALPPLPMYMPLIVLDVSLNSQVYIAKVFFTDNYVNDFARGSNKFF